MTPAGCPLHFILGAVVVKKIIISHFAPASARQTACAVLKESSIKQSSSIYNSISKTKERTVGIGIISHVSGGKRVFPAGESPSILMQ